jgi:hypothetical protein
MRKLATTLAAAAAAIVVVTLPAASSAQPAAPADGSQPDFAEQAEAAGLTAREAERLQDRVDQEVARTDGTQVSLNKVLWGNGGAATLLALPGEERARDVTDPSANTAGQECNYEYLCAYTDAHFGGDKFELWECDTYSVPTFASWINNQTTGTTAYFRDGSGSLWLATTAYEYDAYDAGSQQYVWTITNC